MPEHFQTIVFMVRHGQTDNPYSQNVAIDAERQLTKLGREQSRQVGRFLDQFSPTEIYSSPLDRCLDTAKIIQGEIEPELPLAVSNVLVEVSSLAPRVKKEAGERGKTIFSTILRAHKGEQVVAVTHQFIIGYIVAELFSLELSLLILFKLAQRKQIRIILWLVME